MQIDSGGPETKTQDLGMVVSRFKVIRSTPTPNALVPKV